jgi:ubiquinone/menaquinone biosynthesis C-methylase UbiE
MLRKENRETNIEAIEADITRPTEIRRSSVDLIYISTVIHGFSKKQIHGFLKEANSLLKPGGTLAIVEIEKKETPFGPPMEIRISPEELKEIVSFAPLKTIQVGEHFYMQVFYKKKNFGVNGASNNTDTNNAKNRIVD